MTVLSALLGAAQPVQGMDPKKAAEMRAKRLKAVGSGPETAAQIAEAAGLAQAQREAEAARHERERIKAREHRMRTVADAPDATAEEIRKKQAQQALESLRREKRALETDPAFQSLLAQIRKKEATILQLQSEEQRIQNEQPRGTRTWEHIQTSHVIAIQNVASAQSELETLLSNTQYQKYSELQGRIADVAPAPATAPAAAEEEEEALVAPPPPPPHTVAVVEEEEILPRPAPAPPPPPPPPAKKSVFEQHPRLKPTLIGTGAAILITGALYAGLKWYQRRHILKALRGHDLNLTMLSSTQKDALAAAVMASYRIPRSMRKLAVLARRADFASADVPEQTMWEMLAELYYREAPTGDQVEAFRENVLLQ